MTNEKMFSDVKQFSLVFIPINWLICLIVSLILLITMGKEVTMGYLLGSITSFLTFGLLMKNTSNVLQPARVSFRSKIMGGSFVRLLVSLVILAAAFYSPNFNFIATIVGMLVLKVVLVIFVVIRYTLFKDKVDLNNKDKEAITDVTSI